MRDPIWSPLAQGQSPRTYSPGQFIYHQAEEPKYLYYLLEGSVRSFISSPEGAERVLTIHRSGDLMGEASFFDGYPRVSSAVALTECKVISVDGPHLEAALRAHPEMAVPMLRYLSHTIRELSGHVDDISFRPAEERLALALLRQSEGKNTLHTTHEELGASVGVSRVTVSRVLSQFARRGWVSTGYGELILLDRPALEHFVQPDDI